MLIAPDILYGWGMILAIRVAPLVAAGAAAYYLFKRSELGHAILARAHEATAESVQLAGQLQELREQLAEVQERVDFSERTVAQLTHGPALDSPVRTKNPTPPAPALSS